MRAIRVSAPGGLDALRVAESERLSPGPDETVVKIAASSLNYHDYLVANGTLPVDDGRILMSDGAGEVVTVGDDVSEFAVGDLVISTFFPRWWDGPLSPWKAAAVPGDSVDGMARDYVTAPASSWTRAPAGYTAIEAATLPCAALTAWHALMGVSRLQPGDTVLTQGTGGVSIFALQFAKAAGARVIATSSSESKLERLHALGADHTINYRSEPKWGKQAKKLTGGRGVDSVVEVGGANTLGQSIRACRMGGTIAMVGVLSGLTGEVPTAAFFQSNLSMTGITVGSRAQQLQMIEAIELTRIKPVIARSFPVEEVAGAFRYQEDQRHFGKICVTFT